MFSRKSYKAITACVSLFFISLIASFAVLQSKSFYPYDVRFYIKSDFALLYDQEKLTSEFTGLIKDKVGDSFYIDSINRINSNKLLFLGRYYTKRLIQSKDKLDFIRSKTSNKMADYLATSLCSNYVNFNNVKIIDQLLDINKNKKNCYEKITTELKESVQIESYEIKDQGRLKKILFVAFIVSLFFGCFSFLYLERHID